MPISLLLIFLVAISGMMLTYLVAEDRSLLWRLAAGNIVGGALWGLVIFVTGLIGGFSTATVAVSLIVSLLPAALLMRRDIRNRFDRDVAKAKGKLQGANAVKGLGFVYYAIFFLLFCFFFSNAIYTLKGGVYTGGSQNYGDLPFHLGAIFSFTEIGNFPPMNPSWAGAKFSYPFIADLLTACIVKLGGSVEGAIIAQDISWAFSLLVILEAFVTRITGSRLAGRIGPALLFFNGGLSFIWTLKDYSESGKGLIDFLWHLTRDYTINDSFRWGDTMVVLFMTQRSLLLGMPLTILVLDHLWKVFVGEKVKEGKSEKGSEANSFTFSPWHFFTSKPFLVGLLAGTLPLVHLHSLVALFIITGFLFFFRPDRWREWIAFGIGVAIIAIPEIAWSMAGSATETSKFFGFNWGWDKGNDDSFIGFWIRNTGLLFFALAGGIWLLLSKRTDNKQAFDGRRVLLFYIPFAVLFVICNVMKLAPWSWDNIKILIYWFIGSIPIVAFAIAWMWRRSTGWKVAAVACLLLLVASGAVDVWRTATGQVSMEVFQADAVRVADQIKQKTDTKALFLNAPTFNSAVVLSGRQSLMRYSGHLSSYGIDYIPREEDVKRIYQGGGVADMLLKNYNIDYVLISPEERNTLKANEEFFRKYPVIAEAGQFKVYKIKQ